MDIETFFLIEVPGGDRRYIERRMTPERYKQLKEAKKGTRIFKICVAIPEGKVCDLPLTTKAKEWEGEFGAPSS